MRRRTAGSRRPATAHPVDGVLRRLAHLLPPHIAVIGQRHVGIDAVGVERFHGVEIRLGRGAWRHAEEAGLGIDGVEPAVLAELHPADVVADGLGLPAGNGRHQHGEVGLAAGRGEGRGHELRLALGIGELEDQHVLGHPALVAGLHRSDAQRMALLAEERIAAIARAIRPDLARLGEMRDVLRLVAGPRHVGGSRRGQRIADRVHAAHEILALPKRLQDFVADAGHDVHVGDGVSRVGHHDADAGDGGADRAHGIRHHVHGAAGHRSVIELGQRRLHLGRVEPVVGGPRVVLRLRADIGLVLDPRDVRRVRAHQDRVRPLLRVEPHRRAAIDQRLQEMLIFLLRAVAPHHLLRLEQSLGLFDEGQNLGVGGLRTFGRNLRLNAHAGLILWLGRCGGRVNFFPLLARSCKPFKAGRPEHIFQRRHGRACPGHPRLWSLAEIRGCPAQGRA